MPSSEGLRGAVVFAATVAAVIGHASRAEAQQQPQGFAVERFYPSAPGGGWFVMDALDMRGNLGGAMAVTGSYALKPLRVTDGAQHLAVVSDQAFTDFGFAATYDRFRLYLNLNMPLTTTGQGGTVGAYRFSSPSVSLGATPDTLSDPRLGLDVRLFGGAKDPLRVGAGAQLFVPNGRRSDYDTDGSFRGMLRVLAAGDVGLLAYAGHLGVHVRPLDDSPAPGSPQGSEMLFGAAVGARLPVDGDGHAVVIVGPEIYGETAFQSFFGSTTTGLEALLTSRLEGTAGNGPQLRVKLGSGGGLNPHFGAPEWRAVIGIEIFDHRGD